MNTRGKFRRGGGEQLESVNNQITTACEIEGPGEKRLNRSWDS